MNDWTGTVWPQADSEIARLGFLLTCYEIWSASALDRDYEAAPGELSGQGEGT